MDSRAIRGPPDFPWLAQDLLPFEEDAMKRTAITTALTATLVLASSLTAAHAATFSGAAKDAWITGKVETAFVLNAHMNPTRRQRHE